LAKDDLIAVLSGVLRQFPNIAACCRWLHYGNSIPSLLVAERVELPHRAAAPGLGNETLNQPRRRGRPKKEHCHFDDQILTLSEVCCKQRLGGLLKSYCCAAE